MNTSESNKYKSDNEDYSITVTYSEKNKLSKLIGYLETFNDIGETCYNINNKNKSQNYKGWSCLYLSPDDLFRWKCEFGKNAKKAQDIARKIFKRDPIDMRYFSGEVKY